MASALPPSSVAPVDVIPPSSVTPSVASGIRSFFSGTSLPASLPDLASSLRDFLRALPPETRIVCVTSGGTTVPLERNTVRFVDNFSTGTRGAAMAERFLEKDYAVIFLHRTGSALPVLRRLPSIVATSSATPSSSAVSGINSFGLLYALQPASASASDTSPDTSSSSNGSDTSLQLALTPGLASTNFTRLLSLFHSARRAGGLFLPLHFTSIGEYLFALREVSTQLRAHERNAMVLLAAAVSDYHIPESQMSVHKLDSRAGGPLHLTMEQTPKVLHALRHPLPPTADAAESASPSPDSVASPAWLPLAFLCSFKLETDWSLLVKKSRAAIRAYGVNAVLANELHSRYDELRIVHAPTSEAPPTAAANTAAAQADPANGDVELLVRRKPDPNAADVDPFAHEIEVQLVERLVQMHAAWMAPSMASSLQPEF